MSQRSKRLLGVLAATAAVVAAATTLSLSAFSAHAASAGAHRPSVRATVEAPPVNAVFDYQIGGAYTPAAGVQVVDRDRLDPPAAGRYNICYVNGFQTQPAERAWWAKNHPDLLLQRDGKPLVDADWPDEYILDISTAAKRDAIAAIERPWIDGCATAGYRGLEIDNLDTYDRGYPKLTRAHALAFATLLVTRAHAQGLAVGQKNAAGLGSAGRTTAGFDFAIAEECQRYSECADYTDVYGAHVIDIEYTDYARRVYTAACTDHGAAISVILRDRDVVTPASAAYRYETC